MMAVTMKSFVSTLVLAVAALTVALTVALTAASAAPTAAPIRAEIDALLTRLEGSGCQFNRNGSWYVSAEAREHLLRKLSAIERRGDLQSTEQFIDLAATSSSLSGKPYQVRCGGTPAVPSRQWLLEQLGALRAAPG